MCICMCIHLQEHQNRPVMQRNPRGILHVEMASESAVCEINAHVQKYREHAPVPRISMLANERAGGECEALRNKRPLMLDCAGFPINLEIRGKGGEFRRLVTDP